jgi:hypothetical protein
MIIANIASAMAAFILRQRLESGASIEIPRLGISISGEPWPGSVWIGPIWWEVDE